MDSVDSSPNYMRARSRFDPKKENSPGGSESDEIMSVSSSTCGSSLNEPHARKLSNNGIKHRTSNNKNFASVRSFRRRPKPRFIQSPLQLSDHEDDEASPHYLKATTSSEGKRSLSQASPRHSVDGSERSTSHSSQPKLAFSRTSSLRNVRILMKRASFRPKRSLLRYSKVSEGVGADRATYSSTIKDSKYPAPVELQVHPGREECEKSSAVKVCRYHHCSLHGGCHESGESAPPLKHFLYKRKQALRKQKGVVPNTEMSRGKQNLPKRAIAHEVEFLNQERISDSIAASGVEKGNNPNEETELFVDGYNDVQEAYLVELAFGETSFPERSYRNSLDILRKYSSEGQDLGGASSRCSCHNREVSRATPKKVEPTATSPEEILKKTSAVVLDTSVDDVAVSCKDGPVTPVVSDEKTKKRNEFSSASSSCNFSEEDAEFTTESSPLVEEDITARDEDSETNTPTHNGGELHFSKPRHISMWNLIHQHMSSNISAESTDKDKTDIGVVASDLESETQEVELRKMFAVKLVREAIEKILLPEVQEQASDDQSVTSETTPQPELMEKDRSRACIQEKEAEPDADGANGNVLSDLKEEAVVAGDSEVVRTLEKKAPKHWSNLKKWILLQRFIRALEKVRGFDSKKPRHLPLNPDPEAEKVSLRPQTVEERKSAEEWMLDHALRQAVNQLAPTQKKKVALLVKAFETVVPPQDEDSRAQCRIPRLRSVSIFDSARRANLSSGDLKSSDENEKLEDPVHEENGEAISEAGSSNLDGDGMLAKVTADETNMEAVPAVQGLQDDTVSDGTVGKDRKKHIKMWHMIYQHVVSDIAERVGGHLLDGGEEEEQEEDEDDHAVSSNLRGGLTKFDALKLVKQAVDEILIPEAQDYASDTQSVLSDSVQDEVGGDDTPRDEDLRAESKPELPKSRNWSKLKKLLLLKRSIKALEKARDFKPRAHQVLPRGPDPEPEKVDLRQQMMDERKKAEQWMLDYAVQHIVTTLTPARKRRVAMLVEAFEAVVPLPEA